MRLLKRKFNIILQFSLSAILIILFIFYTNGFETVLQTNNFEFTNNSKIQSTPNLRSYHFEKIVEIEKDEIFNLISNRTIYSLIFPEKILNVEIIDDISYSKTSVMTFHVFGINIPSQIQHKSTDNSLQIISVLNGPAKGSKIILSFSELDSKTKIDAVIFLKFEKPISLLTSNMGENDFREIFNQGIEAFVDYNKT